MKLHKDGNSMFGSQYGLIGLEPLKAFKGLLFGILEPLRALKARPGMEIALSPTDL